MQDTRFVNIRENFMELVNWLMDYETQKKGTPLWIKFQDCWQITFAYPKSRWPCILNEISSNEFSSIFSTTICHPHFTWNKMWQTYNILSRWPCILNEISSNEFSSIFSTTIYHPHFTWNKIWQTYIMLLVHLFKLIFWGFLLILSEWSRSRKTLIEK